MCLWLMHANKTCFQGLFSSSHIVPLKSNNDVAKGLTSAAWNGLVRLPAQPQPVAGQRPGEDLAHVEAASLSQQQHPVIASLPTGQKLMWEEVRRQGTEGAVLLSFFDPDFFSLLSWSKTGKWLTTCRRRRTLVERALMTWPLLESAKDTSSRGGSGHWKDGTRWEMPPFIHSSIWLRAQGDISPLSAILCLGSRYPALLQKSTRCKRMEHFTAGIFTSYFWKPLNFSDAGA